MYSFYCTNLPMAMDVLAEMMDRPDLREFFTVNSTTRILNYNWVIIIKPVFLFYFHFFLFLEKDNFKLIFLTTKF